MDELLECPGSEFYELSRELIEGGHSVRLRVRGQSMVPWIRDGDVIEVVPVAMDQVQVGDVVFFRRGRLLLVHRVIQRRVDGEKVQWITRGDNHCQDDGPMDRPADLIGRVEKVYRGRRTIALDRGLVGMAGRLAARHWAVHWVFLWAGRVWRYGRRWVQRRGSGSQGK